MAAGAVEAASEVASSVASEDAGEVGVAASVVASAASVIASEVASMPLGSSRRFFAGSRSRVRNGFRSFRGSSRRSCGFRSCG